MEEKHLNRIKNLGIILNIFNYLYIILSLILILYLLFDYYIDKTLTQQILIFIIMSICTLVISYLIKIFESFIKSYYVIYRKTLKDIEKKNKVRTKKTKKEEIIPEKKS